MTTLILVTPYLAFVCGVAMMMRALHLWEQEPSAAKARGAWRRPVLAIGSALAMPTLAQAQVDLRTAAESGNAVIMYVCATFAAVGILAAGVAMMTGRQSIAKWAFVGALVSGLAFPIVRTIWGNIGLEASGVGAFGP